MFLPLALGFALPSGLGFGVALAFAEGEFGLGDEGLPGLGGVAWSAPPAAAFAVKDPFLSA